MQVDDATAQLLDDNIVMTQAMAFSPFKKPFEERLQRWGVTLRLLSDTLDSWLTLQVRQQHSFVVCSVAL